MDNKLKELTEKLYGEGLEKGRAEADRLVSDAKAEAARIVAEAKAEAEAIVRKAEEKAADTAKNSLAEIALAGKQAVAKIKGEIAAAIIAKGVASAIKETAVDADFIKSMLLEVAKNWKGNGEQATLSALLPASLEKELSKKFAASAKELLAAGIEVGYSESVKTGFKVGEKGGGYYIAFTDESFEALMHEYLRENVSQLLFA